MFGYDFLDKVFFNWLNSSTCPHHHFKLSRKNMFEIEFKCKYCGKDHKIPNKRIN